MRHDVGEFPVHFFGSNDYLWTYQARVFPYMDVDANSKEKMGKGVDATYRKGSALFVLSTQSDSLSLLWRKGKLFLEYSFWLFSCCPSLALEEAATRFRELQTEKEMRQLQEDRKNDRKPPPYKHIKVREETTSWHLSISCVFVLYYIYLKQMKTLRFSLCQ